MLDKINQSNSDVLGDQVGRDKIENNNFYILNDYNSESEFTKQFQSFLDKTELNFLFLSKELNFNDLYIPIDLRYDNEDTKKINIETLYLNYIEFPRNLIIYGDEASGKTSSLKYFVNGLKNHFKIIYSDNVYKIQLPVESYIKTQEKYIYKDSVNFEKTILFIDDFHKLSSERIKKILESAIKVKDLYLIITVDDIFIENIKAKKLIFDFEIYGIKTLGYNLEYKLIENWLRLKDYTEKQIYKDKEKYKKELDNVILKSILPKYPFFLYTILSNLDNNLDNTITSYGHCYQTLIHLALSKVNIDNKLLDSYYNILTELSFYFYKYYLKNNSYEIYKDDIILFFKEEYDYNLKESIDNILKKLDKAKLLTVSSCGYYKFEYQYIYYFYLGKYFANTIEVNREIIHNMIENLDKKENAYIIIFLIHHTNDEDILSYLQISMMCYYDDSKKMTLDNKDLEEFKKWNNQIFHCIFNSDNLDKSISVDSNCEKEYDDDEEYDNNDEFNDDEEIIKLRKALKSVEVMGHILNNRFGSIKKKDFNEYLEFTMDLLFRIAGYLFNLLKEQEKYYVDYFYNRLKDEPEIFNNKEKLLKKIRKMLFTYSVLIVISTIKRCTHTILSDNLTYFIEDINNGNGKMPQTPLTILIEKDLKMTYDKSIDYKHLEKYLNDKNIDDFLKNIYKILVYEYLYNNDKIEEQERQKLRSICKF